MSRASHNPYLESPLPTVFVTTALPIVFIMLTNGLQTVVDAVYLGRYVGPEAISAVTAIFPVYMLIVALATLVASGMSSLLARHLGADQSESAARIYASAHWLALSTGAVLVVLYLCFGGSAIELLTGDDATLSELGASYIRIGVFFSPILFVLAVNSDALRNEGHVTMMAVASLLVSLSNIAFNYLFVAKLQLGIAGSAYGTIMAQALALIIILGYRLRARTILQPMMILNRVTSAGWGAILALGVPQSLGFVGIALGSSAILFTLQLINTPDYEATVAAYGIVNRAMTFAILPVLGISQAMQTITGNNYGAGKLQRVNASLRLGLITAFIVCGTAQGLAMYFAGAIGGAFVDDPQIISKVSVIMPTMVALYFLSGPLIMIASHHQAIGDVPRAAVLSLAKPYIFVIPLTLALPLLLGHQAIWWAAPTAEALLALATVLVLVHASQRSALRWGLFYRTQRA